VSAYDALLFDFDGVLADTEPVHWACWAEVIRPLGIELDWETYQRHAIGATDVELVRLFASMVKPAVPVSAVAKLYPAKQRRFQERATSDPPIAEGTIVLLKSLKYYGLAVVTSSSRSEIAPVLERAGILGLFGAVVCFADTEKHKPDPEPYLLAARRLGAKRPLVLEDSGPGLESGRRAGFDVVHVTHPSRVAELVREALR
jgi:HAD superfamily hydrolase (TIGR01509 family)